MKPEWKKLIETSINDSIEVKTRLAQENETSLDRAIQQLLSTIRTGGKILLCGNGGSAADAQHIAAELVIRLKSSSNRPAIAAQALTVDTSIITAGANDFGFDYVFFYLNKILLLFRHEDNMIRGNRRAIT